MASTYSANLSTQLIATGDQSGTWGSTTNTNLGVLMEQAISSYVTQQFSSADVTLAIAPGADAATQPNYGIYTAGTVATPVSARNMYIECQGTTSGGGNNLIVPAVSKLYFVYNNTTGGSITVKTASGTGIAVPVGTKLLLVCNGTNVISATSYLTTAPPGGSNTQIQYNNAGSFGGSTLTYNNSTGGFSIAAPTSGVALTSIGVSGQFAISAVGANVSGSSYGLGTQAGFTSADYSAIFRNYGGTTLAYIRGDGQSFFNQNVTIAAPSSGTGLTVLGSMLVGAPTGGDKGVGTINATGLYINGSPVSTSTGTPPGGSYTQIQYNNAGSFGGSTLTYNNSNGSFSIGAPTSAVALTVTGTGAYNAINAQGAIQVSDSTVNYLTTISSSAANSYIDSSYTSGSTLNFRTANTSGVVTQRVSINSAGAVTINASTSGTALTVNGAINSVGDSSAVGLYIGTTASAIRYIQSGDSYIDYSTGSTTGTLHFRAGSGFRDTLDIGPNGNVTINAPSSGTALAITGLASQYAWSATDGTSTTALYLNGASGSQIGTYSNHAFTLYSNNAARVAIAAAGNVTINAPSSGNTLLINNIAGQYAFSTADGTTQTFWYTNAGGAIGTMSNHPFSLYTNNASRVVVAAAGNVTINAPTSGAALTVTAATGGTTNAGLVVTGSASTPTSAVTFSATAMTIDCTRSNVFTTTFTANVTTAPSYSNPQDGQTINWFITQDATGTRTMTWGTSVKWPGGTAGVLSTAANAVDLLVMTYRSSTGFWYATLSKGFA